VTIRNPFAQLDAVPGDLDPALANMLRQWHAALTRSLASVNPAGTDQVGIHRDSGLYVKPSEMATALAGTFQPLDSDLTAIAALATTAYGRAFLALADAAAGRTALGFSSKYHYAYVPFIAAANTASATLTTHPSTAQFLCNNNRNITKFDTTHFSHVRMLARVTTGSASANTPRLRVRYYKAAFSTTLSDYADIGSSEVSCSLTSTGLIDSGWISIVAAAGSADIYLTVDQIGGDSSASPAVGQLQVVFRGVNTEV